ncbi:MAG: hypothetical protein IJO10_09595 [Clostridia bacterium]|nr:hypothetical protein [Clostridia bacterium]MBQ7114475.1 hypothetical protein [Clostridia bacterium]
MQKRPAMVYFRKKCIRRRALRSWLLFLSIVILLCCCHVKLLAALVLSGAVLIVIRCLLRYE